jgi:hypothetical protein
VALIAAAGVPGQFADAHPSTNSATFTDSKGEKDATVDVSTVTVSNDDKGNVRFQVDLAAPVPSTGLATLYLDVDTNTSTGAGWRDGPKGFDYVFQLDFKAGQAIGGKDPKAPVPCACPSPYVKVTLGPRRFIFDVHWPGASRFDFLVLTEHDFAPDWPATWRYDAIVGPAPVKQSSVTSLIPSFRPQAHGERIWRESKFFGGLDVRGRARKAVTLKLVLRQGTKVDLRQSLRATSGVFEKLFRLPLSLLPGTYKLEVGPPTVFPHRPFSLTLLKPPEGIVSEVYASEHPLGRQRRIPKGTTIVFANFHFVALPNSRLPLDVHWTLPTHQTGTARVTRAGDFAFSYVKDNKALPFGSYTAVLTAGGTIVKRLTFRLG